MKKPCAKCRVKDEGQTPFIQATVYDGNTTFYLQKMCLSCCEAVLRRLKGT